MNKPIFVLGCCRLGTTWVGNLLHSSFVISIAAQLPITSGQYFLQKLLVNRLTLVKEHNALCSLFSKRIK